jgi:hypothetical protein
MVVNPSSVQHPPLETLYILQFNKHEVAFIKRLISKTYTEQHPSYHLYMALINQHTMPPLFGCNFTTPFYHCNTQACDNIEYYKYIEYILADKYCRRIESFEQHIKDWQAAAANGKKWEFSPAPYYLSESDETDSSEDSD